MLSLMFGLLSFRAHSYTLTQLHLAAIKSSEKLNQMDIKNLT